MRGQRSLARAAWVAVAVASLALLVGCAKKAERQAAQETLPPEHAASPDEAPPEEGDPSIGPAITGVRLGDVAPLTDVKMLSVDGRELSLADIRGKQGLLVVFTCNACPYARAWEQRIVTLGNEYIGHGIGVIAVNANDPAVVAEDGYDQMKVRAAERGMKYPYVVDATSRLARKFGATRTPEAFLFGADGKLVYHGTIDDNAQAPDQVTEQYLRNALTAVVSGEPVPQAETKSMGCSIKFRT